MGIFYIRVRAFLGFFPLTTYLQAPFLPAISEAVRPFSSDAGNRFDTVISWQMSLRRKSVVK
jgi:hypothetical protein